MSEIVFENYTEVDENRGTSNDAVIFPGSFRPRRSKSWLVRILDALRDLILSLLGMNRSVISKFTCCYNSAEENNSQKNTRPELVCRDCHGMRRFLKGRRHSHKIERNQSSSQDVQGISLKVDTEEISTLPNQRKLYETSVFSHGDQKTENITTEKSKEQGSIEERVCRISEKVGPTNEISTFPGTKFQNVRSNEIASVSKVSLTRKPTQFTRNSGSSSETLIPQYRKNGEIKTDKIDGNVGMSVTSNHKQSTSSQKTDNEVKDAKFIVSETPECFGTKKCIVPSNMTKTTGYTNPRLSEKPITRVTVNNVTKETADSSVQNTSFVSEISTPYVVEDTNKSVFTTKKEQKPATETAWNKKTTGVSSNSTDEKKNAPVPLPKPGTSAAGVKNIVSMYEHERFYETAVQIDKNKHFPKAATADKLDNSANQTNGTKFTKECLLKDEAVGPSVTTHTFDKMKTAQDSGVSMETAENLNQSANGSTYSEHIFNIMLREHRNKTFQSTTLQTDLKVDPDQMFECMERVPPTLLLKHCVEIYNEYDKLKIDIKMRVLMVFLKRLHQYLMVHRTLPQTNENDSRDEVSAMVRLEHIKEAVVKRLFKFRNCRPFSNATYPEFKEGLMANINKELKEEYANYRKRKNEGLESQENAAGPVGNDVETSGGNAGGDGSALHDQTGHQDKRCSKPGANASVSNQIDLSRTPVKPTDKFNKQGKASGDYPGAPMTKEDRMPSKAGNFASETKATNAPVPGAEKGSAFNHSEQNGSYAEKPSTLTTKIQTARERKTVKQQSELHPTSAAPAEPKFVETANVNSVPVVQVNKAPERHTASEAPTPVKNAPNKKKERRRRRQKRSSTVGTPLGPKQDKIPLPSARGSFDLTINNDKKPASPEVANPKGDVNDKHVTPKVFQTIHVSDDHDVATCKVCRSNRKFGCVDDLLKRGYTVAGLVRLVNRGYVLAHCSPETATKLLGNENVNMETLRLYIDGHVTIEVDETDDDDDECDEDVRECETQHVPMIAGTRAGFAALGDPDTIEDAETEEEEEQAADISAENKCNSDGDTGPCKNNKEVSTTGQRQGGLFDCTSCIPDEDVFDCVTTSDDDEEECMPMRERRRLWRQRRLAEREETTETLEVDHEQEPQAFIPDGATFDFSRLTVEPGHGDRPNKKKLKEVIKEKVKTKGKPNKHLEKRTSDYDSYSYCEADDSVGDVNDMSVGDHCGKNADIVDCAADEQFADDHLPVVATELPQTVDDREFNMVPEEILRREDTKLKELEEKVHSVVSFKER